jgi:hypothetical protein
MPALLCWGLCANTTGLGQSPSRVMHGCVMDGMGWVCCRILLLYLTLPYLLIVHLYLTIVTLYTLDGTVYDSQEHHVAQLDALLISRYDKQGRISITSAEKITK